MVRIGIVGATGMVGRELLTLLQTSRLKLREIRATASAASVGKTVAGPQGPVSVEPLVPEFFAGLDFSFFCTGTEISAAWIPRALSACTVVIDNSSAFRSDPRVPLLVPEVNGKLLSDKPRLIANPNCCVAQLTPVLAPIAKAYGLSEVTVTTYQAVSGAGMARTNALAADAELYPHCSSGRGRLLFNILPAVGSVNKQGHSGEEEKIVVETRKILNQPRLPMAVTSARVPVFRSHCLAVTLSTECACTAADLEQVLSAAKNVAVVQGTGPEPVQAAYSNCVFVGRIRANCYLRHRSFSLWIVADNLRKGAADNALSIAEHWCDS